MTQFLQHLFLASFWTYGVRSLFSHPNVLYPVYAWLEPRVSEHIIKPTIGCFQCMASVWGAAWFFIFLLPGFEWFYVFPFMVCLCGLNSIVDHAIN